MPNVPNKRTMSLNWNSRVAGIWYKDGLKSGKGHNKLSFESRKFCKKILFFTPDTPTLQK